jgi:hypothetical protein
VLEVKPLRAFLGHPNIFKPAMLIMDELLENLNLIRIHSSKYNLLDKNFIFGANYE